MPHSLCQVTSIVLEFCRLKIFVKKETCRTESMCIYIHTYQSLSKFLQNFYFVNLDCFVFVVHTMISNPVALLPLFCQMFLPDSVRSRLVSRFVEVRTKITENQYQKYTKQSLSVNKGTGNSGKMHFKYLHENSCAVYSWHGTGKYMQFE